MSVDMKGGEVGMTVENVIRGLECCIKYPNEYGDCMGGNCPYGERIECHKELIQDALALLKAQEPRVMTLEELRELAIIKLANNDEIVWAEDNGSDDCCDGYCSPDLGYPNDSIIILWEPGNDCSYMPNMADYGVRWRCWTSRPTDEQREVTAWINQ